MTRRSSLRAQAQRIYSDSVQARTPTLTLPLSGGGNPSGEGGQTALTARARKLYEESAVPMCVAHTARCGARLTVGM